MTRSKTESSYDEFARQYDAVMGSREETAREVKRLLRRYHPKARTLLELGCGTGSMLALFQRRYTLTGVDLSQKMLEIAAKKVPGVPLLRQDITRLDLRERYDVILCVFDTMNHITDFRGWKRVFVRVAKLLAPGGIFVFDVNTPRKMERYASELPYAELDPDAISIVEVIRETTDRYELRLRLLSRVRGETYRLHETRFSELVPKVDRISRALSTTFSRVRILDSSGRPAKASSEEVYFVCSRPK